MNHHPINETSSAATLEESVKVKVDWTNGRESLVSESCRRPNSDARDK